ncbi:MAG: DNA polymerase III subunit gamma/tau [Gammaproteobacteria bacterium]|nr:DNA polymerase III subunit gamma/tau [Gammaproteobacteria bacterium]
MSYQVLARKWRPRNFTEMVGQEHVLRALINALDNDRLHHAFLFTGTRGVGKTTVARILAKSLNCEQGMGSTPCGVCSACREIDEGRFVDLIEVDAASRTKVEDTRDLLDNVQYAPSRGRYKVYLIDEVHMLSNHSFNALLKTLEEPPPHVKFLLATTDPQKLPVTILSRCLQFNLKRLPLDLIRDHLGAILGREGVAAEPAALNEIARAADGSMRDALSLLDQAIAYGGGRVETAEVREMLGTIDRDRVAALLQALAGGEGAALLARIESLAEQSPDFAGVLAELNSLLHRIALVQQIPAALDESLGDGEVVRALATQLSPEAVQLYYQIGILGRRDLPLAPEPRSGFEMVLLRMLAFCPTSPAGAVTGKKEGAPVAVTPGAETQRRAAPGTGATRSPAATPPPGTARIGEPPAPQMATEPVVAGQMPAPGDAAGWASLVARLPLTGMTRQMAEHCALASFAGGKLALELDPAFENMRNPKYEEGLRQALGHYLGGEVRLVVGSGASAAATPVQLRKEQQASGQATAEEAIAGDTVLQSLLEHFDGTIQPGSVRPLGQG